MKALIRLVLGEKVEIAMRIENALAGRQGGDRGNQYTGGKTQNFAGCQPKGESRDIAAKAVDMNRETYRQAKTVVEIISREIKCPDRLAGACSSW